MGGGAQGCQATSSVGGSRWVAQRVDRGAYAAAMPARRRRPAGPTLFDVPALGAVDPHEPLAARMRPRSLAEFEGQESLTGEGRPLRRAIERDAVPSAILWGPPGSGKTTLARIIARETLAEVRDKMGISEAAL